MFLVERNLAAIKKSGIKIYFDCGERDRYQFQDSNKVFDEKLTKLGLAHEFHLYPGNHGWGYMISVADHSYTFLCRLQDRREARRARALAHRQLTFRSPAFSRKFVAQVTRG